MARSLLVRHGSVLSLLTLASRVLGLFREMVKASFLGTTALSDAFSVAFLIPNLFRRLFAEGSIAVAFIPTFKAYLIEGDKEAIREFLSCIWTFLTFFVTLAVIAGMAFTPLIMPLFKMEQELFDETVFLTRLMFPFLAFISLAALFQGILNSLRIFTPSGLAPILLNLVTIGAAFGLSRFTANPARAMAIGILAGGFLEAAVQFPFILKKGWAFCFVALPRALANPGVRKVLRLIVPTIIGMAAYQVNDLVSTALARRVGEGVASSLQYSLRLQELMLGVFAVSIGTVLLPDLAEYAKSSQWDQYRAKLTGALRVIALITVPATFFLLVQGEYLIRLFFQIRSFGEESVRLTLNAFTFHIIGLFFIALNRVLAPAFYACHDSASPSLAGVISFAANSVLALALSAPLKGAGIALSLSAASGINTALLFFFLTKNPHAAVGKMVRSGLLYTLKIAVFALLAVLPVYALKPALAALFGGRTSRMLVYGLPLGISALVYGAAGFLLLALAQDPYARRIIRFFKKKKP
ncbi:MAG: murein biosynthesis integral membrane protein MurJ [Spirochaetaceae bacterium]|jgi:putative peptidoglycan lipid II flippase|nr:murein biosynthesis integral membrane protein MurJ [Spirochaetaceae bacterium]